VFCGIDPEFLNAAWAGTTTVDVIVIDHAEKPDAN
jgi:hypothetical protein